MSPFDDAARTDAAATAPLERSLERIARGDQTAFAELYDQLAPRVFGMVLRVLVDRAQSEEVTQEVFLDIWRKAPTFQAGRGSAVGWALSIAHAKAVDRVRASQSQRDRDERVGVRGLVEVDDDVSVQAELRIEGERARRAMQQLPDAQREAIELAYFGGLTQSEIAARLQAPLGTVKTRMRDGMRRLRDLLEVKR